MCFSGLLLAAYAAILLAGAWFQNTLTLDAASRSGRPSLDPSGLTVQQLTAVLDSRGVSYAGALEKGDLARRVIETGGISLAGLQAAAAAPGAEQWTSKVFASGSEFYEVVEDTKDSAWLVRVVPQQGGAVMDQQEWGMLMKRLASFDVRFGSFDCQSDPRFCRLKEWSIPTLVLALPRGYKAKADIFMRAYSGQATAQAVQHWVASNLAQRIRQLRTNESLEEWFDFSHNAYLANKYPVRLLCVSSSQHVPLFFSALTVKFTGRVKFSRVIEANASLAGSASTPSASYILSTPEQNYTYGLCPGADLLNLQAVGILLSFMAPDANDLLAASCMLINMLCLISVSVAAGQQRCGSGRARQIGRALWQCIKCNAALAVLCMPSGTSVASLPVLSRLLTAGSWLLRRFALSPAGALSRQLALAVLGSGRGSLPAAAFAASFVLYCVCVRFAVALWCPGNSDDIRNASDASAGEQPTWLDALFHRRIGAPASTGGLVATGDVEEGLQAVLLIERLSAPSFWLQPYPSYDYINELPTWRCNNFRRRALSSSSFSSLSSAQPSSLSSSCSDGEGEDDCSEDTCPLEERLKLRCSSEGTANGRPAYILQSDDCSICLELYRKGDMLVGLPCGHCFHQQCIMRWLLHDNALCPVCRWPACIRKTVSLKVHSE